jgi:pseudaminic acid biosynthesis-associated methylase
MFRTEQERFWAGDFGTAYSKRNEGQKFIDAATGIFARILTNARDVTSVLELGANIGINMHALKTLLPEARLSAVEINPAAHAKLSAIPGVTAHLGSILDYTQAKPVDLAFTSGVLIHINPDELPRVYDTLYNSSRRYVAIAEYYSERVEALSYRGEADRLWKRDWCAEIMKRHPLKLIDYGFIYHGDPAFLGEDLTWFLMERS